MQNNNSFKEYTMEKTYFDLKRECNNKEFCLEAALSEYIDNSIQSILDDYNKKYFLNTDEDVIDFLEKRGVAENYNIIQQLQSYNLTINIKFSNKKHNSDKTSNYAILEIQDNACGIDYHDLKRCMDTNKVIEKKRRNSMHFFGIGMKISSFWLGDNAIIYSKTKNDNFVSIGNYNSLDNNLVFKENENVKMSIDKSYDNELLSNIGESGTIIKIEKLSKDKIQKMLENSTNSKNESNTNNLNKTIGMKYYNYLKNEILKINLVFINPNTGEEKIEKILPYSLEEYDSTNTKLANPFIISRFYETNLKDQKEKYPSIDEFQNILNNELLELANNPKNKLINDLYENNQEFRNLFNDINKPIQFTMKCKMKNTNETFPIKIGFLNKGEQKFSNVNVKAQWRYIHLPCFDQNNEIIHQLKIANNWDKENVTGKWSYMELCLRDLPNNNNFELFTPDRNKTEIIQAAESEYKKSDIIKTLREIKEALIPLTNMFKNLDGKNSANIKKFITSNDFVSQKIKNSKDNSFQYKTKNETNKISFDNVTKANEKIIEKINETDYIIYSNNEICELKDEVDHKTLLFIKITQDYFNDIKKIQGWVKNNEWIKSFNNFEEINKILEKYDDIETVGEYIKNE